MKINLLYLILLVLPIGAQNLMWRTAGESKINLQIQEYRGGESPEVGVYRIDGGEPVMIITEGWTKMSVAGFWENKGFSTAEIEGGLYRLLISGVEEDPSQGLLSAPGQFQTYRADFDYRDEAIKWKQLQTGPTRVLVQFASGMMIAQPADWDVRTDGGHQISWDFIGADGRDYSQQPALAAVVQMASFEENILVVGNAFSEEVMATISLPEDRLTCKAELIDGQGAGITAPQAGALLKVTLDPASKRLLTGKRFEILVYLDGVFLHEESQGVSPSTFTLPANLPEDSKTLTVNVLDYEGNWGVSTIEFKRPATQ